MSQAFAVRQTLDFADSSSGTAVPSVASLRPVGALLLLPLLPLLSVSLLSSKYILISLIPHSFSPQHAASCPPVVVVSNGAVEHDGSECTDLQAMEIVLICYTRCVGDMIMDGCKNKSLRCTKRAERPRKFRSHICDDLH